MSKAYHASGADSNPRHPITPALVAEMLRHIPAAVPRDKWARYGMAIKSEFDGPAGFELFNQWSQSDPDGYDPKAVRATWQSTTAGGGVTIGTLIRDALDNGFKFPDTRDDAGAPAKPDPADQKRREQARKERERNERVKRRKAQDEAAAKARKLWDAGTEDGAAGHPYLQRKGVQAHGVRLGADGRLIVPMRDAAGDLRNVQQIDAAAPKDGAPNKWFLPGSQVAGLFHAIGLGTDPAVVVTVAEGYATAASVHEATGWPAMVAFNANNLKRTAQAARKLQPDARILICGDDDGATAARTGSNPGEEAAAAAARAVAGMAVLPQELGDEGGDFNDLHARAGLDEVRQQIQRARQIMDQGRKRAGDGEAGRRDNGGADTGDPRPADLFSVANDGVFYEGYDKHGNRLPPLWLCSRLDVAARTRNTDGQDWGFLLEFHDPAGRAVNWSMPAAALAGDGASYRAELLSRGLAIATSSAARSRLTEYLQTRNPQELATCTNRVGWHGAGDGRAVFVLPDRTIGEAPERVVFQAEAATENTYKQRGTLADWREKIGALCVGNSRLTFAVSCAFAGALVRPGGVDSGGFHFRGASSSGKTTALKVAASVHGGASYLQRWRATSNALELVAAAHSDGLLILDELAQIAAAEAGETAYLLANESGKLRATRGASLRARLQWRLLFLSAGELSLSDHVATAGKRTRAGQQVRMVDLDADAGAGLGLFEDLHGRESGAQFASELTRAAAATYGNPGRAWLQWLAPQWQKLAPPLRERVRMLCADWVPAGASGQVERVAARFALVAAAGELATGAGLTGWPKHEATRAARVCFESWLQHRGGIADAEIAAMLAQVRRFLEVNGEGRFTWWHRAADDRAPKTLQRAGVRRMINAAGEPIKTDTQHLAQFGDAIHPADGEGVQTEFFILPEVFRSEVCAGFDHRAVCRALLAHECMSAEETRQTTSRALPSIGKTRCYHVLPAIFNLTL